MYKGIIFDMDGTMVDNMMVHHRAWQRKLNELGLELTLQEIKEKIHGINEDFWRPLHARAAPQNCMGKGGCLP
jgi:beta-phosphoglucomutase